MKVPWSWLQSHLEDPLPELEGSTGTGETIRQHNELVVTQPSGYVTVASDCCYSLGHRDQQLVTGVVAKFVVHCFEVIEINHEHCLAMGRLVSGGNEAFELHVELGSVGDPGESIVERLMAELFDQFEVPSLFVGQ